MSSFRYIYDECDFAGSFFFPQILFNIASSLCSSPGIKSWNQFPIPNFYNRRATVLQLSLICVLEIHQNLF